MNDHLKLITLNRRENKIGYINEICADDVYLLYHWQKIEIVGIYRE